MDQRREGEREKSVRKEGEFAEEVKMLLRVESTSY